MQTPFQPKRATSVVVARVPFRARKSSHRKPSEWRVASALKPRFTYPPEDYKTKSKINKESGRIACEVPEL